MSNRDSYVARVQKAIAAGFTMTEEEYIDALEELISELECRLDAAKETANGEA